MKRTMQHRGVTLEYEFAPKRVKNLNLRVRADGSVAVSAPRWVSKSAVEDFLRGRWDWILAAQQKRSAPGPAFGWQPGESFHLLGQPVAVEHRAGSKATAQLEPGRLVLVLPAPERAAAVGGRWYDSFCHARLAEVEQRAWSRFSPAAPGVGRPALRLRWMTSRWGSCANQKGTITLNKRLFSFPPPLAEYVLLHEYCHLLHPNHQAGFYALLGQLVPNRKELDRQLKSGAYRFVR